MEQSAREKLLDRIRKILALSQNNNSEKEAESAWKRVQSMLAEHNMVMEDLEETPDDMSCEMAIELDSHDWIRGLAYQVSALYFCVQFYAEPHDRPGKDRHFIAGEKHNVAVARLMFDYIRKTIERLADEAEKKAPLKGRDKYRESFIYACTMRITARIAERIAEARKGNAKNWHGENLPVLASEYDRKLLEAKSFLDQQFGFSDKVETRDLQGVIRDQRGMQDGRKAGDNVGLETQVTNTKQQRLI